MLIQHFTIGNKFIKLFAANLFLKVAWNFDFSRSAFSLPTRRVYFLRKSAWVFTPVAALFSLLVENAGSAFTLAGYTTAPKCFPLRVRNKLFIQIRPDEPHSIRFVTIMNAFRLCSPLQRRNSTQSLRQHTQAQMCTHFPFRANVTLMP